MMALAARMAWRNLKSGETALLTSALVLAVTVVATVAIFTSRLEASLSRQTNALLGADVVLQSSRIAPAEWFTQAETYAIKVVPMVQFASMAAAGDILQLASIRAVSDGYPLRGEVTISRSPFDPDPNAIRVADGIPPPGEVWVDARLLPLLELALDDRLEIGQSQFRVTQVIVDEPNASNPFSLLGAGLMMNLADLENTQVIQPGSRVQYGWQLAGESKALEDYLAWLKPQFSDHEDLIFVEDTNRGLQNTLTTGRQFLLLAAVMGVLLAGIAIGISARQFAHRHTDQVVLLKSFGISALVLKRLYLSQMLLLATVASLVGLVIGEGLQRLMAQVVLSTYDLTLLAAGPSPYLASLFCGFLSLTCFALPAIWHLPGIPPLKILRRETRTTTPQLWTQVTFAAGAVAVLILIFSRDITLALSVLAALSVVTGIACLCAWLLLRQSKQLTGRAGSIWRLAMANLYRRLDQSLTQLVVFSIAILLLVTMIVTRQSLIQDWQMQIPDDAPNHFLVNVPPAELETLKSFFNSNNITREPLYPMVRGRLTAINDQGTAEKAAQDDQPEGEQNTANDDSNRPVLNREANLTWAAQLAQDNQVVQGQWWDAWQRESDALPGVSVEEEFAERADIHLGDKLTFSVGGLPLEARVASLRSLDWRSMKPNFFFIFEPGSLDAFSATYITSFYLPAEQKPLINTLITNHPTAVLLEIDKIIRQIQTNVQQISNGVLLVLVLIVTGGALVMASAVNASLAQRKQEIGLLRALGSPRKSMLNSLAIEFGLLGIIAGLIAATGSEVLLLCLQHFVLETPLQPHWAYWLVTPLISALALSALGVALLRRTLDTPPAVILRQA